MKKSLFLLVSLLIASVSYGQIQPCTVPFFSEYVEGTNNSKAVEIYNPTNQPFDLGAAGLVVARYSNGSNTSAAGGVTPLSGVIPAYGTWILVNGQTDTVGSSTPCDPALQALADQLDGAYPAPTYFNGNDALTLETQTGIILDIFGKVGEDPGTGWTDIDTLNYVTGSQYWWLSWTSNRTLVRKSTVKKGVTENPGSPGAPLHFMVHVEWDTVPGIWVDDQYVRVNIWDNLGSHECECETVGVSELPGQEVMNRIYLFPNPASNGTVLIKATAIIENIELINSIGQVVKQERNPLQRGDFSLQLPDNMSGLHYVRVTFENGTHTTQKLIIK